MDLIVSVSKARDILGESAKNMNDNEIINIIQVLDMLGTEAIKAAEERRKDGDKD